MLEGGGVSEVDGCAKDAARDAFDCRLCGHCCEGQGGIVVSDTDLPRLCAFLSLTPRDFEDRFGLRHCGKLFIRSNAQGCIFFSKESGCTVHAGKPDICRAWPYFRGNLVDGESLALAKEFCPGIPPQQSHEDFVREGLAYLLRENLAGSARRDEAVALQVADLFGRLASDGGKR